MAIKMLEALSGRLRVTNEFIEDSLFLQLPSRLAKKLLIFKDMHGVPTANGVKLNIRISQQELGNLVGASRESVNKQMRAWEEVGLIRMDRGYITICKIDALT